MMRHPFIDKSAGRYHGDDDAKADAFRELQTVMQELRGDCIVYVAGALTVGGQYSGQEIIDRTTADGLAASDANWGMTLDTPTIVIVNVLEYGATTHNIPVGTRLVGRRRANADDSDTVFVNYPAAWLYGLEWAEFYDTGMSFFYGIGSPG